MKKTTDRELLDKELKALNRKLMALAKIHRHSTVPGFMFVVRHEIRKRTKITK